MTHRGPFQPLLFCDSVILRRGAIDACTLCCHAPPVRKVGQLPAAVPWYLSASPVPVGGKRFPWAGEVTPQLRIETLSLLGGCAGHCSEQT